MREKTVIAVLMILVLVLSSSEVLAGPPPSQSFYSVPAPSSPDTVKLTDWNYNAFSVLTNSYHVRINYSKWRETEYFIPRFNGTWADYKSTTNSFEFQWSSDTGHTNFGFYNYIGNNYNNSWYIKPTIVLNSSVLTIVQVQLGNPAIRVWYQDHIGSVKRIVSNYTQTWWFYNHYYAVEKKWYLFNNATSPLGYTNTISAIEGSGNNPAFTSSDLGQDKVNDWVVSRLPNGAIDKISPTNCSYGNPSGEPHLGCNSTGKPGTYTVAPDSVHLPYSLTLQSNKSAYPETVSETLLDYSLRNAPANEKVGFTIFQSTLRGSLSVPFIGWGSGLQSTEMPKWIGYRYLMSFGMHGGSNNATTVSQDAYTVQRTFNSPAIVAMSTGTYQGFQYPKGPSSYKSAISELGYHKLSPINNQVAFRYTTAYAQKNNYWLLSGVALGVPYVVLNGVDVSASVLSAFTPQGLLLYYPNSLIGANTIQISTGSKTFPPFVPFGLDGLSMATFNAASQMVSISTSMPDDTLMLSLVVPFAATVTVTDSAILPWSRRGVASYGPYTKVEEWTATSSTVLSNDQITVGLGGGTYNGVITVFAVTGAGAFDRISPVTKTGLGTSLSASISTTNPNTFVFAIGGQLSNGAFTLSSGGLLIGSTVANVGSGYKETSGAEYQIFTAQQTIAFGFTSSSSGQWALLVDAIQAK